MEGKNWRAELNKVLHSDRSSNYSTNGFSPAELFFKRNLTTKLPKLKEADEEQQGKVVFQRVRDSEKK